MAFFPRFNTGEFAPLFRLLDDYDVHRSSRPSHSNNGWSSVRAFAPKFDVKEFKDGYQLDGELPGIDQKDIKIEFTDPHTLVIKGRTEREYTNGTPPALEGSEEESKKLEAAPAIETAEATEETAATTTSGTSTPKSHQATVEDEGAEGATTSTSTEQPTTTTEPETAVEKSTTETPVKAQKPKARYWVSERSVGEFHRTFSFPTRVDQDAVKASLKNGILSIVVPKAAAPTSKRITIE